MNFKAKKGKNKYNMFEWWIKKSQHLKIYFTAIKTKILTEYGQKVEFFIRLLDCVEFWTILYDIISHLKR